MKINEILNEQTLMEATFDLDKQVDFIYDRYFAEYVDDLRNSQGNMLAKGVVMLDTTDLPRSDMIDEANKLNPCRIVLHNLRKGNMYVPDEKTIFITVSPAAVNLILDMGYERALNAINVPSQKRQFKTDLTEGRVKGSIYHELAHWLDDTLHNRHIKKRIDRAQELGGHAGNKHFKQNNPDVNMTNFERQSQIHNIKQLKRSYEDTWDQLSFDEMIRKNAALSTIADTLWDHGREHYEKWRRQLLQRMAREDLVGASMRGR